MMAESLDKRPRILMLVENNDYSRDVRVRQEALSLAGNGYHVDVICPGPRFGMECTELGVRIWRYRSPFSGKGFFGYLLEYGFAMTASFVLSLRIAVERGFDVVHAHNPPDTFVFIGLFYKLFGKSFVFDHHDLAAELYRFARFDGGYKPLVYRLLLALEKLSCSVADHVIVTNESYRQLALTRSGVAAERVTVVRNGPELRNRRAVAKSVPKPAGKIIGYVGIMGQQDGVDLLIRAADSLVRTGTDDFHIMLVGAGVAVPSLRTLVDDLRLTEKVTFVGWIEQEELASYIEAFDVCVAPEPADGYSELSTMIKVMEYMASSKPVVAFDLLEHRRTAGSAALYATGGDPESLAKQVKKLLDDPELRSELGRIGRERVESKLAWQYQERSLLSAYDRLITGRLPQRRVFRPFRGQP